MDGMTSQYQLDIVLILFSEVSTYICLNCSGALARALIWICHFTVYGQACMSWKGTFEGTTDFRNVVE